MTWSRRTNRCGSTSIEARQDLRHLHPREVALAVSGSRRPTAIDRLSVEMYGNGWPGSTASGVRTG